MLSFSLKSLKLKKRARLEIVSSECKVGQSDENAYNGGRGILKQGGFYIRHLLVRAFEKSRAQLI